MSTFEGFEAKTIIPRDAFIERADQLNDVTLSGAEAGEIGRQVVEVLTAVQEGNVEIVPPLSPKQAGTYKSLGQKGIVLSGTVSKAEKSQQKKPTAKSGILPKRKK